MCKNSLAHCDVNSIFITNTHTHTYTHTCAHTHMCTHTQTCTHTHVHTHTRTCTHTDWACNACSDCGFLFLTLSLQSVHVYECTHICAYTHTQRLSLYHLQSFYKAYMCMNEHTYTHVHTHTVSLVILWVLIFHTVTKACICA